MNAHKTKSLPKRHPAAPARPLSALATDGRKWWETDWYRLYVRLARHTGGPPPDFI